MKSSAGNNLKASDYTNLTATVKGGTAPYSYRFWIRNNDTGKEWTAQQFTKDKNTCRWYAGPSGATKGKTVFVDIYSANLGSIFGYRQNSLLPRKPVFDRNPARKKRHPAKRICVVIAPEGIANRR